MALGKHLIVVVRVLGSREPGCVLVVVEEGHDAAVVASPRHLLEQV